MPLVWVSKVTSALTTPTGVYICVESVLPGTREAAMMRFSGGSEA